MRERNPVMLGEGEILTDCEQNEGSFALLNGLCFAAGPMHKGQIAVSSGNPLK